MSPLGRPRILLNFASSLDGKIAPVPDFRSRTFAMSRHREDRRRMREIREKADVILIGAGNLRADNPPLSLSKEETERRRASGVALPYRAVITRLGEGLSPTMRMFQEGSGGTPLVFHSYGMDAATRAALAPVAKLICLGGAFVEIPRVLQWLDRVLEAKTVLCEGGGILAAELFKERAIDELYLTLVPRILGGTRAQTFVEGPGLEEDEIPDARLLQCEQVGDELFLHYAFDWTL